MKTLIELSDERPLENVLAAEIFRPRRDALFHQLQDLRREDRRAQRAGRPARPLRRADGPGRDRRGGARQRPHAQPRAELNIRVIDLNDLAADRLQKRLLACMQESL